MVIWGLIWGALFGLLAGRFSMSEMVFGGIIGALAGWTLV
jgi:hypothetical protein